MIRRATRVAAYAACIDPDGRMLLCRLSSRTNDPGSWTLPGGGIDFGEDPADAVLRELTEETGLTGVIVDLLGVDSHISRWEGSTGPVDIHGIRIVYRLEVTGGSLRDELDGSTDTCAWLSPGEADAKRLNALVRAARLLLAHGPAPTPAPAPAPAS